MPPSDSMAAAELAASGTQSGSARNCAPMLDDPRQLLPADRDALLVGRIWMPSAGRSPGGPAVVAVSEQGVFDLTHDHPTVSHLIESGDASRILARALTGRPSFSFDEVADGTLDEAAHDGQPRFLSPIDLQPVKACGVTFYDSLVERLVEERTGGKVESADEVRLEIVGRLGDALDKVVPGSAESLRILAELREVGIWSQYLEVAIGEYAEIFTKAAPLASVGSGGVIGVLPESRWNNPEPEGVLVIDSRGRIVGATLGNDVNHRDIEGRSALLLGRAKDNNASCAIGPFVRLIDDGFSLERLRSIEVQLEVLGSDGFMAREANSLRKIRRDIVDIAAQCIGPYNSYPDGVALMLGASCSLRGDRREKGMGFTHSKEDVVRISSPHLGMLVNRVRHTHETGSRSFGIASLMFNLARRGLLSMPEGVAIAGGEPS